MVTAKGLLAAAGRKAVTVRVEDALALAGDGETVFVDLRDSAELRRDGKVPGALHINRGVLEFALDPASAHYHPVFSSGKNIVFYCASGMRSVLAAETARQMGLRKIAHLGGGFKAWSAAGGPIEREP
jgi:rhodanese-related sulfurtransferase